MALFAVIHVDYEDVDSTTMKCVDNPRLMTTTPTDASLILGPSTSYATRGDIVFSIVGTCMMKTLF